MKNRYSNSKLKKDINKKIFSNNLLNNKIINNKITLYVVTAIALFSLYIHITRSHFSAILLFFLTAGLVYTFTKNMTIVLGAAFIVTTIASLSTDVFGFKEGFKEGKDEEDEDEEVKEEEEEEEDKDKEINNSTTQKAKAGAKETAKAAAKQAAKDAAFNNQKLSPALFNSPSKKNVEQQLGKATEVEQAYDNLEKIMGSEKINSISTETKDLIKQQNELIKQLKSMTPALNSAMASLGGLDLNKLTGMFNSATKNLSEIKE
jgi:flagellar biosynthesis GTPase FlhF